MIPFLLITFLSFSVAFSAQAESTYLSVGQAKTKKSVIALTTTGQDSTIQKTIEGDLDFVDLFKRVPANELVQAKIAAFSEIKFEDWAKAGVDYISYSSQKLEGEKITLEFHLAAVGNNKDVLAKQYTARTSEAKILGHTIANDIFEAITGKKGIFLTKIACACEKSGKKEIYTFNFDGSDVRQITKLKSITMSPAWSPDGTRLAFSVYNRHSDNTKNLDLYEYNFKTGGLKPISNRKGINSGVNFSPKGGTLALTMSYSGNPEIHVLDLESKSTTQITRSVGFDVDPSYSPDGSKIAFVSSRVGKPMVYVASIANPEKPTRLTYAGQYNASPNWSPDGKKIVFAGWLEKHFDLFTITSDGAVIDRLTKNEGNNEDPHYSPDGNFVVFSSNRSAGKNVFIMNTEGTNVKRLTFGMGNCVAPKWSPYLN